MGLGTAAGSVGQIALSPFAQSMIGQFGWNNALLIMGACTLCIIPLAFLLPNHAKFDEPDTVDLTLRAALREAFRHRGYVLLTIGFFVCGFHVTFIMVHLPAYVVDLGLSGSVAAWCLALIGVFNIIGSIAVGLYGQRHSNSNGLSFIYAGRAIVIAALLLLPKTEFVLYLFSCSMGLLWLSTIPLTTGVVTRIFGVRYMATLFAVVFFSHQMGSFIGVWLGGYIHDLTGTYNAVWQTGIVLAIVAAVLHVPINEKPLRRAVSAAG
jgi:predicted MFS family arabinose efflux permease